MSDTTRRRLDLAFATDLAYVPWCATAVASCLRQAWGDDVVVHLLHDGSLAGHDDLRRLGVLVDQLGGSLRTYGIPEARVAELPRIERFGSIVWGRFLLPELLLDVHRVLYLDADVLARGSVAPLWDVDLVGAPVGAVANVIEPGMGHHVRRLGLDPGRYVNSGVLLLDLEALRAEDLPRAIAEAATAHQDALVWPDQDALNVVFRDRWHELHPRWNAQNSLWLMPERADAAFGARRAEEARATAVVLHFEGPTLAKPWHVLCQHPARAAYLAELAGTPWAGVEPEDRSVATRLIRCLPRRWWVRAYVRLLRWRERQAEPVPAAVSP